MYISKIKLYLNTVKYLKLIQIHYRFKYLFLSRFFSKNIDGEIPPDFNLINWVSKIKSPLLYSKEEKSFSFLNIKHQFSEKIDWNYNKYGELWIDNLNYFDFLNQENISKETGLLLISDFIKNEDLLKIGKKSYPISSRGINWVKFLAEYSINDFLINKTLYCHYRILLKNLEYHLLANHLLENAFSLIFGAYYFQDETLYDKSYDLLISELNEQVLMDGAHFELSPMYHKIILFRVLDCIQLIKLNNEWKKDELLLFLEAKASVMVSWLHNVTYENGNVPMVNDATYNIAPSSAQLFSYAKNLGIINQKIPLSDSGYRKINAEKYELFLDIGNIGPDYQPGHAHSDTFNFELNFKSNPIIVDTGISTYEKNSIRQLQRSTFSHNTVLLGNSEQSEVWGGFRVGRRAKVFDLKTFENKISAKHNGYKRKGIVHKRSFEWFDNEIFIHDFLSKKSNNRAKAIFHFHSNIKKPIINLNQIKLNDVGINISFHGSTGIKLLKYDLCKGFNKTEKAFKLVVNFNKELKTVIYL